MEELQKKILTLTVDQKLSLLIFIADSLKEDLLLEIAQDRKDRIQIGKERLLTLEELKDLLFK